MPTRKMPRAAERAGARGPKAGEDRASRRASREGSRRTARVDRDSEALPATERKDRIIDVAIRLAEEGGFDNVRQRDVARLAGVALGTLYKSFRSKEDILAAALHRETDRLEQRLERKPIEGKNASERLSSLFSTLTRTILRKPNYARAVLKAMTSGEEVASKVVAHQIKITRMVIAALRGTTPGQTTAIELTLDEIKVAVLLQQIWFAALVGWSARLHGQARVVEQVGEAAELLIAGLAAQKPRARGRR